MTARSNGEGSVSLRKDGRWEVAAYVPWPDGTRRRVRQYAKSSTEAMFCDAASRGVRAAYE